ncbi:MAG: CCA tRNA nucleotidyltransferase [Candidatus Riflebacteria bacterium]|nr:CCA tRNA nucleotidyltransferase [Candidatus Riflebacteria bacterium]
MNTEDRTNTDQKATIDQNTKVQSTEAPSIEIPSIEIPQAPLTMLSELLYGMSEARNREGYLVGGTVRDLFLKRTDVTDFDLAFAENPSPMASNFARAKKAGFVLLDEEHAVARIIRSHDGVSYTFDLAKFRAPNIDQDLAERDFTINAMSIRLQWPLLDPHFQIYDPLNGLKHLAEKKLIQCSDEIFNQDPVRLMRAFRFASKFDWEIPEKLYALIVRDAEKLKKCAFERIRDEFFKVLSVKDSCKWIRKMDQCGILQLILPELIVSKNVDQNRWHHLDVFEHTLLALENFEKQLETGMPIPCWKRIKDFLSQPISGNRTYEQLFKLAILVHDIGKPICKRTEEESGKIVFHGHEMEGSRMCEEIAERLKLSGNECTFLMKVTKNHMRPGVIIQEGVTERRLFKYFSETGRDGLGVALLSLADREAAQGPENKDELPKFRTGIENIISDFFKQMEYKPKKPLLTGHDLIAHFNLAPGPLFRKVLEEIKEAQHLGKIQSRNEALELAGNIIRDS